MRHIVIEELLKPLIRDLGYELWGCVYLAQKNALLRLYIDKPDGINIKDCEYVSKRVSAFLDVEDPLKGGYRLEVSSPGIPRPLFNKEQYRLFIGHMVQMKLLRPVNGARKISGIIVNTNEDSVLLQIEGNSHHVEFSSIVKANLIGE